jgi:TolA-binding protein
VTGARLARAVPPLLVVAITGCWVPIERGRLMEARIDRLEVETREQGRVLDEQVKDKLAQVDRKLKEVQVKLDELNTSARATGADLRVDVGKLKDDLTRLRGELEAEQHRLGLVEQAVASSSRETEARLAALRGTGALDEAMARQKLEALPRPDDRAAVLGLAQAQEAAGEKGVAREIYLGYARRWPRDDQADEAAFRAGLILSDQGRWREAVVVLGKVVEDYPKSARTPDALVLLAEGMVQLDRKDDARAFLDDVVARFPTAPAASRARERLAELFPPPKRPVRKPAAKRKK